MKRSLLDRFGCLKQGRRAVGEGNKEDVRSVVPSNYPTQPRVPKRRIGRCRDDELRHLQFGGSFGRLDLLTIFAALLRLWVVIDESIWRQLIRVDLPRMKKRDRNGSSV